MIFEQRFKEIKGASYSAIWRKHSNMGGDSKCKRPEVRSPLVYSRVHKEFRVYQKKQYTKRNYFIIIMTSNDARYFC